MKQKKCVLGYRIHLNLLIMRQINKSTFEGSKVHKAKEKQMDGYLTSTGSRAHGRPDLNKHIHAQ
jgi:hypothetical protein